MFDTTWKGDKLEIMNTEDHQLVHLKWKEKNS